MFKYVKWIFLLILIGVLIIIGIKFVSYDKFKVEDIYNQTWISQSFSFYQNNKLVSSEKKGIISYNMIFNDNIVTFCDYDTFECYKYSFEYIDRKITINTDNQFLEIGTYNINLKDNILELHLKNEYSESIYSFVRND